MQGDRWQRNLAAVWTAQAMTAMAFSFVFPFIPLYVQVLGVQGTAEAAQWAAYIGAAAALSMTVAQPIWGTLADRSGRKPMVIRSMLGGAITIGLMGFATSPEQLLILRFIQGTVTGVVAAATALVATSTPKPRLGFALGLMQVAMFGGTSAGPLLGGLIADTLGYRVAFYAAAALMLSGSVIVARFVHEDFTRPPADAVRPGVLAESRSLLAIAFLPVVISVIFLIQLGGVIITPVLSLFIADLAGGESAATAAGTILAATGAVSAISAILVGRYNDRIGPRRILPICLAGAALTYFPQAFVTQVWQLLLLRILLGAFLGGLMPTVNSLVATLVPEHRRGAAYGLTATANAAANGIGPLTAAGITTYLGIRAVFLFTAALFALVCGWVALVFHGREAEQPDRQPAGEEEPDGPSATCRPAQHGAGAD